MPGAAQIAGDTDRAEQLATEALRFGTESSEPDAAVFFAIQQGMVCWQRGTMGDLVRPTEQMVADNPGLEALPGLLAIVYTEAGRTDDARRLLEDFAAAGFELPMDAGWIEGVTFYAETAIECRDAEHATGLFDLLAPWADQWSTEGSAAIEGPVAHYLGGLATVLGRYRDADVYFTQAAASCERADAKFFAARTNLSWGRMLAERGAPGDIETARELLTNARTAAAARGYANVERRVAEALQDLA